jgi:predicted ABC-type transport system involved in lysophospholipase L1 biosynthesis ATPase subunit
MANIKMTMTDAEYDRIKDAFARAYVANPELLTDADKKLLVDTKVKEFVTDVVVAQDKAAAAAAVVVPDPPVITPE